MMKSIVEEKLVSFKTLEQKVFRYVCELAQEINLKRRSTCHKILRRIFYSLYHKFPSVNKKSYKYY